MTARRAQTTVVAFLGMTAFASSVVSEVGAEPAAASNATPLSSPDRIYLRGGVAHIRPLESASEVELRGVDGPASLAVSNGPIAGSGAEVDDVTVPALIVGWVTPWWNHRLSLELVLGMPFEIEFRATGTLATESIAPEALGIPTGIPPLGSQLGTTKAAPPAITAVYRFERSWGPVQPYSGAGLAMMFAFDGKVTNPILSEVGSPELSIPPAPGLVLQSGLEVRIWGRFWANLDVKFIAGMLARARLRNVVVRTPEFPLFEEAEVGTASMNVWLNPVVVQLGAGVNF